VSRGHAAVVDIKWALTAKAKQLSKSHFKGALLAFTYGPMRAVLKLALLMIAGW
jgi:hypothetical protein